MKLSELQDAMVDLEEVLNSPAMMHVHLGCDCGCGGDMIDFNDWQEIHDSACEAEERVNLFCKQYGIENDVTQ